MKKFVLSNETKKVLIEGYKIFNELKKDATEEQMIALMRQTTPILVGTNEELDEIKEIALAIKEMDTEKIISIYETRLSTYVNNMDKDLLKFMVNNANKMEDEFDEITNMITSDDIDIIEITINTTVKTLDLQDADKEKVKEFMIASINMGKELMKDFTAWSKEDTATELEERK